MVEWIGKKYEKIAVWLDGQEKQKDDWMDIILDKWLDGQKKIDG